MSTCASIGGRCGVTLTLSMAMDEEAEQEAEQLDYDLRHVDVALLPTNRNWSSGTFACHQQPAACLLATACPCVQVFPAFDAHTQQPHRAT